MSHGAILAVCVFSCFGTCSLTTCTKVFSEPMPRKKLQNLISQGKKIRSPLNSDREKVIQWVRALLPNIRAQTTSSTYNGQDAFFKAYVFHQSRHEEAKREWEALEALRGYSKTPKLIDCFELSDRLVFVFERLAMNLYQALMSELLAPSQKLSIAKQMATIVRDLHKMKITHGDVKPENFMCVKENCREVMIIDFGHTLVDKEGNFYGSCLYFPPERIPVSTPKPQTLEMEYWMLAVSIMELMDKSIIDYFNPFCENPYKLNIGHFFEFHNYLDSKLSFLPKEAQNALEKWVHCLPEVRSTPKQILNDLEEYGNALFSNKKAEISSLLTN